MPEAKRSSMFPRPVAYQPGRPFRDRLRGRDVTPPRYLARLTKEEQESEQSGVPSVPSAVTFC